MKLFKGKKEKKKKKIEEDKNNINLENEDTKSIFENRRKTLHDLIATDYDFKSDDFMARIGEKYYTKNLYTAFLPNTVSFAHTFNPLFNFGNIDTSIYIYPIDGETSKAELSKLRTNLLVEYLNADGSLNREDDMEAKAAEAARLREEVRDGLNKIYDVSIISTLYDEDERSLNNNADRLKELLGQSDLGIRNAGYFQEEVFFSNKPIGKDLFSERHTFDKRSLGCIFPFTSNNINHPKGTMIGINMDNGLPIFFDNFYNGLPNYNIFTFAQSGMGKSTLIKMLAARTSTLDKIQNIAIDIEPEYRIIAQTLGGVTIPIKAKSDIIINFFDVVVDREKDEDTGEIIEEIKIEEKVNSVTNLIMVLARGYIGNNKYYDDITRAIVRECVAKEYKRVKITNDPESLYERIDGELISNRVKKIMPTLSSWYERLRTESEKNDNETFRPYYDYLLKVMANFVKVENGGMTCFDGQTSPEAKLTYDIPFINFDLSSLNEETELPLAQYVITDFVWEQLVKRNVPIEGMKPHKMRVIVDEAWRLIKYEEALNFLIKMVRRARKKNTSTCVITQQFDEFFNEETSPIIKQSAIKFFLKPDSTEYEAIQSVFKLTEGEIGFLKVCNIGEVLMKADTVSAKIKILIPDFEMNFVQTNQNAQTNQNIALGAV